MTDVSASLGLRIKGDGRIVDTIEGLPAAQAGIGPGMKVAAVNGRRYSASVLREALKAGKSRREPLELLVENGDFFKVHAVGYSDGERYPRLTRDPAKPDLLSQILKARVESADRQPSIR